MEHRTEYPKSLLEFIAEEAERAEEELGALPESAQPIWFREYWKRKRIVEEAR